MDFDISLTGFDVNDFESGGGGEEPPPDDKYKEQYGVIVMCDSEAHQESVFNDLSGQNYNCKVVVT